MIKKLKKSKINKVTRGYGLLENFLANQRRLLAEKLIEDRYRNGRILDIGCGSHPLFLINTNFSRKFGIDKVEKRDSAYYFTNYRIDFQNFDLENEHKLPFDDHFFDTVTMLAVFEHIQPEKLDILLREIYRILKPGGVYLATTPAFWTHNLLRCMVKFRLISAIEFAEHKDVYDREKFASMLEKGNFLKDNIRVGFFELFMNMWILAKK